MRLLRWVRNEEGKATEDEKGKGNTSTLLVRGPPSFRGRGIFMWAFTPAISLCTIAIGVRRSGRREADSAPSDLG